jgi:hypothetical protein
MRQCGRKTIREYEAAKDKPAKAMLTSGHLVQLGEPKSVVKLTNGQGRQKDAPPRANMPGGQKSHAKPLVRDMKRPALKNTVHQIITTNLQAKSILKEQTCFVQVITWLTVDADTESLSGLILAGGAVKANGLAAYIGVSTGRTVIASRLIAIKLVSALHVSKQTGSVAKTSIRKEIGMNPYKRAESAISSA